MLSCGVFLIITSNKNNWIALTFFCPKRYGNRTLSLHSIYDFYDNPLREKRLSETAVIDNMSLHPEKPLLSDPFITSGVVGFEHGGT
jgi:hypothetical protein